MQGFLRDLWGRRVEGGGGGAGEGDGAGEGVGEGEGSMEGVPLAGWCQSVMFAADLKGSTAVIKVKIEVEGFEDVDGAGVAVLEGRSRSSVDVIRTASVVSEGLRSQGTGIDVEPDMGTEDPPPMEKTGRKRKRGPKVEDGVKTQPRTKTAGRGPSALEDGAKTQPRTKTAGRGKAREGGQISAVWTSVKHEVAGGAGGRSGRAERYSARCHKLEVDIGG